MVRVRPYAGFEVMDRESRAESACFYPPCSNPWDFVSDAPASVSLAVFGKRCGCVEISYIREPRIPEPEFGTDNP